MTFDIKDSGQRESFDSGMVRDVEDDKTDYTLVLDGPMFQRWADHLTKGAKKYAARNWMKANGHQEYARFRRSALRHFLQWYWGQNDEDHAAAVFFNINGAEYVNGAQPVTPAGPPPLVRIGPGHIQPSHDVTTTHAFVPCTVPNNCQSLRGPDSCHRPPYTNRSGCPYGRDQHVGNTSTYV